MPPTVSYLSLRTIAYFSTFPETEVRASRRTPHGNEREVDNVKADIFTVLSGTFLYEEVLCVAAATLLSPDIDIASLRDVCSIPTLGLTDAARGLTRHPGQAGHCEAEAAIHHGQALVST